MQSCSRHLSRSLYCSRRRLIHTTSHLRDLVGPPDPVSNLRPVYYDNPLPAPDAQLVSYHPYSLEEFSDQDAPLPEPRIQEMELQYKLLRQQLDAFNHTFWTDSNLRFESAKSAVLQGLPSSSTPLDRDTALAHFYQQWLNQESSRQQQYTSEFRRRSWEGIVLAARIEYAKLKNRLFGRGV